MKLKDQTMDIFICKDWRGYHLYNAVPYRSYNNDEGVYEWKSNGDPVDMPEVLRYVVNSYGEMNYDDEPKLVIVNL